MSIRVHPCPELRNLGIDEVGFWLITDHCEAVAVLQVQIIPRYNIVGLNRVSGCGFPLSPAASQKISRELEVSNIGWNG